MAILLSVQLSSDSVIFGGTFSLRADAFYSLGPARYCTVFVSV